ncbi:hypothetical protein A2619_02300 [candidate division WWE3 bacterium RIFOXYD1_FULL_39_9]|uniref:Uncharacterized protein n=1 Tax=candidate division WWE3 bacterium RIFOXYD1_FULL_39_9 TaxID=1802649 RepID=A0A1F4X3I0_UNCKA|nr:MAG: hypothetical protein A2619_02300 [candidate division WWE3 bacterium RIFOXYD1_FULL_39_9]
MNKFTETEHGKKFGSPMKAIKEFCSSCIGGQRMIVKCESKDCALFAYRTGKNPFSMRKRTEEQKATASERFKKMWADKKKPVEKVKRVRKEK